MLPAFALIASVSAHHMSSTMAAEGLDSGKIVWAPHLTEGYQLGRIVDLGTDTITVEPLDTPGKVNYL